MKQFYGILLLTCLCIPVIGTYGWLQYQKLKTKQEVKKALLQGIRKEKLVRLAFSPRQADTLLHWEHAREFEYLGQMYDVLKREKHQDSLVYWCWWDQAETLINQQLFALVKKALDQDSDRRKANDELHQFFKLLYYVDQFSEPLALLNRIDFLSRKMPEETPSLYISCTFVPPSPPPRQV